MTSPDTRLSTLASRHPGAPRVLHAFGLDFCCGGARSLAAACADKAIDPRDVLTELDALTSTPKSDDSTWLDRSPAELVAHILVRFHAPLRDELPRLVALANKVETVHAEKEDCPRGLTEHLVNVHRDVSSHLDKEEQILFPMITTGHAAGVYAPVRTLVQEHDDHGANLRQIRALTQDLTPPADACGSWRALYSGLVELEAELMHHIHLENNVLFPKVLDA